MAAKSMKAGADKRAHPVEKRSLLLDVRQLIDEARSAVAATVNVGLTMLYWRIGQRIDAEVLKGSRAEYGKQIVATLSRQLTLEYGSGFEEKNLRRMLQFNQIFPDERIVASLIRQLSWTHFLVLIPLRDSLKREFYAEMCRLEHWSVRALRAKIDGMLYERTAISRKPEAVIRHELDTLRANDRMSPDLVFKDPYILNFLGLKDHYIERDLEDAILREMESFILELGAGFAFLARQKRITVDDDDYYIDLLFFHRGLKRLVAVELKLGDFKPADKGQMELYLRWLHKYETKAGEDAPVGLILCAGKKHEVVELLALEKSGIRVAEYLTQLPPRKTLERQLHKAVEQAKRRMDGRTSLPKKRGSS